MAIFLVLALLLVVTGISLRQFNRKMQFLNLTLPGDTVHYSRHYAFIGSSTDRYAAKVFEAAAREGRARGDYVERLGSDLEVEYGTTDLMKIAIASRVDGIILSAEDNEETTKLIYDADQAGIPVICFGNDCIGSARKSYIGPSFYLMGQEYGKLITRLAADEVQDVLVLMSPNEQSRGQNIIYSGIRDTIAASNVSANFRMTTMAIGDGTRFSAEESMTDLFTGHDLPDIIISLDEINTTNACLSAVEYNKVGAVRLYGFYQNDTIFDALRKHLLSATLSLDDAQVGKECVRCLDEYHETGFVTEYVTVDPQILDADNVHLYLASQGEEAAN